MHRKSDMLDGKAVVKDAAPFGIQAHEFAIDQRVFYLQLSEIFPKFVEALVSVSPPRHQFALAVPDVRECSKAIVFKFEKEVRVVEWSSDKAQLGGIHPGRTHVDRMLSERSGG